MSDNFQRWRFFRGSLSKSCWRNVLRFHWNTIFHFRPAIRADMYVCFGSPRYRWSTRRKILSGNYADRYLRMGLITVQLVFFSAVAQANAINMFAVRWLTRESGLLLLRRQWTACGLRQFQHRRVNDPRFLFQNVPSGHCVAAWSVVYLGRKKKVLTL